jgi:hypothetical protein
MVVADLLGRLSWNALPQDFVTAVGALSMVGALIVIAGAFTYFKKWKWFYREWLTTMDF